MGWACIILVMTPFDEAVKAPAELGIELPQDREELRQLYELMQRERVVNMLEIGSRNGGSLSVLAQAVVEGGEIVAVDMPDGPWGHTHSWANLLRVGSWLGGIGYTGAEIKGNSQDQYTVAIAKGNMNGPIDFCFIDGDHSYEGVKADWENYGRHARICAFHDIAPNPGRCVNEGKGRGVLGVRQLWDELKAAGWPCKYEFISDPTKYGIGVVYPKEFEDE